MKIDWIWIVTFCIVFVLLLDILDFLDFTSFVCQSNIRVLFYGIVQAKPDMRKDKKCLQSRISRRRNVHIFAHNKRVNHKRLLLSMVFRIMWKSIPLFQKKGTLFSSFFNLFMTTESDLFASDVDLLSKLVHADCILFHSFYFTHSLIQLCVD